MDALEIGMRMREARRSKDLRLEAVAQRSGYTKGFLSKIEHGKCSPPISTLLRVSAALGVDLVDLLTPSQRSKSRSTIHTKPAQRLEVTNVAATGPGYTYEALAVGRRRKIMEPFLIVVRPEEVERNRLFRHDGDEFLYVLSGRCDYQVGREIFALEPGDSLYFDATKPHAPVPKGGPVTLLAVFTNPTPMRKPPKPNRSKLVLPAKISRTVA